MKRGRPQIRREGGQCKYGHPLNKLNVSKVLRESGNFQIVCKRCRAIMSQNCYRRKQGLPEVPFRRKTFEQWSQERLSA